MTEVEQMVKYVSEKEYVKADDVFKSVMEAKKEKFISSLLKNEEG